MKQSQDLRQQVEGSPWSLIYPLKGKLTFFAMKQFFSFKKRYIGRTALSTCLVSVPPYTKRRRSVVLEPWVLSKQTLMRSRLRRFCSERCIAANADQKANCFYAAVCTFLSPQNFDSPFGLPQDDTLTLETPPTLTSIPRFQKQLAVFDVGGMQ